MRSSSQQYTSTAKCLHWLMAGIWISAWLLGFSAVHWHAVNQDHQVTFWHKAIASTLLFLIVLRIAWRMTHPAPELPARLSPRMRKAAHHGHMVLYAVALLALPISGWLWSSVGGRPVMVLGLFQLPPLTGEHHGAAPYVKLFHTYVAWGCGILVSGHALIALKHHFIDHDGVLKGMLPGRRA
jgi:cytochrome b561